MSSNLRRIALWGYGRYGKRLLDAIVRNWGARYVVTAIFDSDVDEASENLLEGGIPLLNPAHIVEGYQAGRFEAVVVSVAAVAIHDKIAGELEELGIPATTLVSPEDFRPFEDFERTSARELPYGFTLHEYRSVLGFYRQLYLWQTPFHFFDERGMGLEEIWYRELLSIDECPLNPAFPFDTSGIPTVSLPGEYCLAAGLWNTNYWHFTYQSLDRIMVMERAGFEGSYLLARSPFAEELLALAGIDRGRVVWLDDLDKDALFRFEKLCLIAHDGRYSLRRSAPPLIDIARRIEAGAAGTDDGTAYPKRLFVKRVTIRRVLGIDDIIEKYGFTTIVPEELSVAQQVRYFRNASIVVAPHGANSANSLYMRPGSVFVELFGKRWVLPCCKETLRAKGVHYLPLVETPIISEVMPEGRADFTVDRTILEMLIESAIALADKEEES